MRKSFGIRINWKYAFGEVILIFVGITLAFLFDNWKDDKSKRSSEIIILKEISANLDTDIYDLTINIKSDKKTRESLEILIEGIRKNLPYHDSLAFHFGRIGWFTNFLNNDAAYESLKSIGFNQISNDSLRYKIIRYYNYSSVYLKAIEKEIINSHEKNIVSPFLMKYFEYSSFFEPAYPINYSKLGENVEYRSILYTTSRLHKWKISVSKGLIDKAEELKSAIDKHVKEII